MGSHTLIEDAAAEWHVVLGRRVSGKSDMVLLPEEMQTSVRIQAHSPHPALIPPPTSNLGPGGFGLQNLNEVSESFLMKRMSHQLPHRRCAPTSQNPD